MYYAPVGEGRSKPPRGALGPGPNRYNMISIGALQRHKRDEAQKVDSQALDRSSLVLSF